MNNPKKKLEFYSIRDVATMLSVHIETVRRWDKEGKLKSVRIGDRGHRKYRRSDIEKISKYGE